MDNFIDQDRENLISLLISICKKEKIRIFPEFDEIYFYGDEEFEKFLVALKKYRFEEDETYKFMHKNKYGRFNCYRYGNKVKIIDGLKIASVPSEVNNIIEKLINSFDKEKKFKTNDLKSALFNKKLNPDLYNRIFSVLEKDGKSFLADEYQVNFYYKGIIIITYSKKLTMIVKRQDYSF